MRAFKLLMICTSSDSLLLAIVCDRVYVEGKETSKRERLHSIYRVGCKFEFATILRMRCKVSPIDVIKLFFQLDFDGDSWRASRPWNPDMICPLVNDTESWLERVTLLIQRNHLHDIGVADTNCGCVGQRYYMIAILLFSDQRDHFEDVVIEH